MDGISLTSGVGLTPAPLASAGPRPLEGFGEALADAIGALEQLQHEADASSLQLATGEPIELHEVMLAQDRASLSLQLAIQVRNKLVEAYQDIMRMQI